MDLSWISIVPFKLIDLWLIILGNLDWLALGIVLAMELGLDMGRSKISSWCIQREHIMGSSTKIIGESIFIVCLILESVNSLKLEFCLASPKKTKAKISFIWEWRVEKEKMKDCIGANLLNNWSSIGLEHSVHKLK